MFFNEWIEVLLFKKKPADIAATSLEEGLKNLAIAAVIVGVLQGIGGAILGDFGAFVAIIVNPIVSIFIVFAAGLVFHILSMIFGGKGSFTNYIGVLAMIDASITGTLGVLFALIIALAGFGGIGTALIVGGLIFFVGILVYIWQIVLTVLATEAVQKLSRGKAIAVILLPLLVGLVIGIILFFLMAAVLLAMASAIFSGMGGATGFAGLPL